MHVYLFQNAQKLGIEHILCDCRISAICRTEDDGDDDLASRILESISFRFISFGNTEP